MEPRGGNLWNLWNRGNRWMPVEAPGGADRLLVTNKNRASARRAFSASGRGVGDPFGRSRAASVAAARLSRPRRLATGTNRANRAAPRSGVSRPEKQNAPSASFHEVKDRVAWIRDRAASGSLVVPRWPGAAGTVP